MNNANPCPLCADALPGELLRTGQFAIIDARELMFPGFTRVVWLEHIAEMTDLTNASRQLLMQAVFDVEAIMRQCLNPHKVNLASLGNQVAHLHWHVIPRWRDDAAFPASVWGPSNTTLASQTREHAIEGLLNDYHQALKQHFLVKS